MNDIQRMEPVEDAVEVEAEPEVVDVEASDATTEAEEATTEEAQDEGGLVVTFGDEEAPAEAEEKPSVRGLRKALRKEKAKRKAAEAKLDGQGGALPKLPEKPTLEACEYDAERFERELIDWTGKKQQHDREADAARSAKEAEDAEYAEKFEGYKVRKASLKVDDFDDSEDAVRTALSLEQQSVIIDVAQKPETLIYALGKNDARLTELSKITNPIRFAAELARLEATMKVGKRTAKTAPETRLEGNAPPAGAGDAHLKKLETEADRTGDRTKLIAYKRKLQQG